MTAIALQLENRRLKKQLAERDAIIADQAALTLKLQRDIEQLQKIVKQLLATRGGGHHIPEGQGLLFPDLAIAPEGIEAPSDESDSGDDGDGDSEADCTRPQRGKGSKRTPRKVDTTDLPIEHRVHDMPESQRIDPATGKPLIVVGEKTFDEIDYIRAQLIVVRHKQRIYGLPPEEAEHRKVAPVVADLPPRQPEYRMRRANVSLQLRNPSSHVAPPGICRWRRRGLHYVARQRRNAPSVPTRWRSLRDR